MATSAEELQELRLRLTYDTPFWAGGVNRGPAGEVILPGPRSFQGCARILSKQKQRVPFIARPWQVEFDDLLEAQRAKGMPMRAIVLKARKLGFSSWVAAKYLQRLTQMPNQHAIICAQDVDTAGEIFNIAKRIYAHLPEEHELGLGFNIKPALTGQSFSQNGRKHMAFGERSRRLREAGRDDESILEIDTANAVESGRGYTPSLLHLSEVARWPERAVSGPQSKMLALLDAIPYVPETIVVLESTANGLNHFYRRWIKAKQGEADPDTGEAYVTIFVPWWRDPDCAVRFETEGARDRFVESIGNTKKFGDIAEDEPMLVEVFECTPEQLRFRRMKIAERDGQVDLFKQEYPSSDMEAFINSGKPYFSSLLVARSIRAAEKAPEPVLGSLRGADWRKRRTRSGTIWIPQRAVWVPEGEVRRGEPWNLVPEGSRDVAVDAPLLEVWEQPVTEEARLLLPEADRPPVGAYITTADVAEGDADTFTQETDFHAVGVWDHRSRMQVAQYESRIDRHLLPLWLFLVALYYNGALLAVEVNSVGMAVNDPLKNDLKYRHLYKRHRYDSARDVVEKRFGWKTTAETKPIAEDAFAAGLQSDTHGGLRSVRAAQQLTTYVKDERGRRGALAGEHDDLLMMAMIAHRVMDEHRPPKTEKTGGRAGHQPADPLTGY